MKAESFKLIKEDARWWSMTDFAAVVEAMRKTGAKRVLEFGPGSSSLAIIEGGAESLDTCEDNPEWARVYEERLVKRFPGEGFPTVVRLHRFTWPEGAPLSIPPQVDGQHFDLALIDGPRGSERRPDVIRYALERCTWVMVPLEESGGTPYLRPRVLAMGLELHRPVTITETGPDAGAFALIGPVEAALPPRLAPAAAPKRATGKKARKAKAQQ